MSIKHLASALSGQGAIGTRPHATLLHLSFLFAGLITALPLKGAPSAEPSSAASLPAKGDLLQVASPAWEEQILYYLLTDRFQNGDRNNNNRRAGEFDPTQEKKYNGGDFRGIADKLDYLADLGVTAVWITPPVANMWWDPKVGGSGYLGRWAENFREVDKHLGDIEALRGLSRNLHKRGMYLIQEIVCSHVGNFFYYDGPYDPAHPAQHFCRNSGALPHNAPTQPPFDRNNAKNPEDIKAAVYHFTPDITDPTDEKQTLNYQPGGLDHLNTMTPLVREALRDSYTYWIGEAGIDGFALAAAVHSPRDFWRDFLYGVDPSHPGIKTVAASLGKHDFFAFGEVRLTATPYDDKPDRTAAAYLGDTAQPNMDGVLNQPLHDALLEVFADGEPTALLSHRINNALTLYRNPLRLVNFLDKADTERIGARADAPAVAQALVFLLTAPGIPMIYYGTEQGCAIPHAAMFAAGYASGDKDHFNTKASSFLFLKGLIALRKKFPALTHGDLTVLADEKNGRGIYAFRRSYQGQSLVAVFNTARHPVLMASLATGLTGQTRFIPVAATLREPARELVADSEGFVTEKIPAQSALVYLAVAAGRATGAPGVSSPPAETSVTIASHGEKDHFKQNFLLQGESRHAGALFVVIDGDMSRPLNCSVDGLGTWQAEIPVTSMMAGVHQLAAYTMDGTRYVASKPTYIFIEHDWHVAGETIDPTGDDHGPKGSYRYPTDSTFDHPGDIAKFTALRAGTNLKLRLTMAGKLTSTWGSKFGFDHVSFSIFLQIPGTHSDDGRTSAVMPLHNAKLPGNQHWNRMAFVSGWGAALFSPEGASPSSRGKPEYPAPRVSVDLAQNAIEITFAASSLGEPASLTGTRIYVASWDYDHVEKRLRPLAIPPSGFAFSGGGPGDPLIMDDALITIGD